MKSVKTASILLVGLAAVLAAGCPAPVVRVSPAHPAPWHDTGTPPSTIAQDRGRKASAGS